MTHKLRCTFTGNVIYVTEKRYNRLVSKYGGVNELKQKFVSLKGKRILEGSQEMPEKITNRIKCSVSGRWVYITNERITAGMSKQCSWENLCAAYICRPAKRLLKEGKTKEDIRQMVIDGIFPEK